MKAVTATCSAVVGQSNGIEKALLTIEPGPNGEHIITSLRRSTVELIRGKTYEVTFRELPDIIPK